MKRLDQRTSFIHKTPNLLQIFFPSLLRRLMKKHNDGKCEDNQAGK